MEHVAGASLDAYCRPGALLPVETTVEIVASAAQALARAHAEGIVHRDIRPANLVRVGGTSVELKGFGLAGDPSTHPTQDGALPGIPDYMSPEQVRGEPLDGRSDLFSLAVVLYELLTGEKPFGGESVSSVLYRIVNEPPKPPSAPPPGLPARLVSFLDRALAKRPEDRFPDGETFAAELRRALVGAGSTAAAPRRAARAPTGPVPAGAERERAPSPGRRRGTVAYVVGAGIVLVLLVAAAWFAQRWRSGEVAAPREAWLETRVRTEPPGLPVSLDGKPLERGGVRFRAAGPFGTLSATKDCRTARHRIDPRDAGGEVVLVLDPALVDVTVDPGVPAATVRLDGKAVGGGTPSRINLDLCRENVIEARAEGYRTATVVVPAGATPLQARTAIAGLRLEAIPRGRLRLPATALPLTFFVDGRKVRPGRDGIELPEGSHAVRAVNEERWIDVASDVQVRAGESVTAVLDLPEMATLVVQAFPANCTVRLRRVGGAWKLLDETPVQREIAAGHYWVQVTYEATGESQEREVDLVPGFNPPLRFAFKTGGAP